MKPPRASSSFRSGREVYQPSRRSSGGAASSGYGKPLSNEQKAKLNVLAGQAFDFQDNAGLIEWLPGESRTACLTRWRRAQQMEAVQIESLTKCQNSHFRKLEAQFLTLAGKDDQAFGKYLRTGRVKDHGKPADTHENRETFRAKIAHELMAHAHRCDPQAPQYDQALAEKVAENKGVVTASYVIAIAKRQCAGRALDSLTAEEIQRIYYTVRNRIAAKEGRGATQNRNKSQRKTPTRKKA